MGTENGARIQVTADIMPMVAIWRTDNPCLEDKLALGCIVGSFMMIHSPIFNIFAFPVNNFAYKKCIFRMYTIIISFLQNVNYKIIKVYICKFAVKRQEVKAIRENAYNMAGRGKNNIRNAVFSSNFAVFRSRKNCIIK